MAVAGAFAFSTTPIFSEQAVKQGVDYIVKEEELWARVVIKSKMVRFF